MSDATREGLVNESMHSRITVQDSHKNTEIQLKPVHVISLEKTSRFDKPLVCFCIVNYLLNAAVSVITPFYPPMAEKAGFSIAVIGYIFSIQPVGSFMFSFFIGSKMSVWGRKQCMIIGLIVQVISITAFGLLELVKDQYTTLLVLSLMIRFFQGVSRAAYGAISFAYVPILWPTSIQQKISIMESLTGLGLMSGPFLGAGLFYLFGYQWVFYSMGILLSFAIIPSILYLPNDNQEITKKQTFKSGTVFSNKNVIALALVVTMTSAGTTFINPMFSIHMETFNINETQSSLLLGSSTIAYIVFIHFVPALLKKFNKRLILTIGILLSALGDFIIAPVQIFPNNWWMVLVGLPIIGVANALCVLPSIPQFIEFIQQIYPQAEHKRQITDISSGLFIGSYSFGILVGPLLGGQVYQLFLGANDTDESQKNAFKWASTVIAIIQIVLALAFFIITDGFSQMFMSKSRAEEPLLRSGTTQSNHKVMPSQSLFSDKVYSDNGASEVADSKNRSYEE